MASEAVVERHEEVAWVAMVFAGGVALVALLGLLLFWRRTVPRWFGLPVLAATLGLAAIMAWTANLGGQIRHTEIRPGSTTAAEAPVDSERSLRGESSAETGRGSDEERERRRDR